MYELKTIGTVLTSKFVGTGPSSYEKRIYRAAVSQRLRNTGLKGSEVNKAHPQLGQPVYRQVQLRRSVIARTHLLVFGDKESLNKEREVPRPKTSINSSDNTR